MHIVGVICARGGSKRIPFKNLKGLNGEPLVRYAIKAALKATMIDRLIVSTDNPEITRVARKYGADSVVSVCEIHERPEWMFYIDELGYAHNFLDRCIQGSMGISQELPKLHILNGGIYATRRNVLFGQNTRVGKKSRLWIMPRERSVDIDDKFDFSIAEFLAKRLAGEESKEK